ncbi:MAG: hypothetical protein O3A81_02760 [bacterium]|nr:hypothetical protein [bacterium]
MTTAEITTQEPDFGAIRSSDAKLGYACREAHEILETIAREGSISAEQVRKIIGNMNINEPQASMVQTLINSGIREGFTSAQNACQNKVVMMICGVPDEF